MLVVVAIEASPKPPKSNGSGCLRVQQLSELMVTLIFFSAANARSWQLVQLQLGQGHGALGHGAEVVRRL
eukprot:Skav220303  [mRNA]  locus=scaffold3050:91385:95104:+ [translate_table: standard]